MKWERSSPSPEPACKPHDQHQPLTGKTEFYYCFNPQPIWTVFFHSPSKRKTHNQTGFSRFTPLYLSPFQKHRTKKKKTKELGKKISEAPPFFSFFLFISASSGSLLLPLSCFFFFYFFFFSLAGSPLWIFFLFLLPWSVLFFLSFSGSLEKSPSLIRSGSLPPPLSFFCLFFLLPPYFLSSFFFFLVPPTSLFSLFFQKNPPPLLLFFFLVPPFSCYHRFFWLFYYFLLPRILSPLCFFLFSFCLFFLRNQTDNL